MIRALPLLLFALPAWGATYDIDCDASETVASVSQADGDTINITGTCTESITIGANDVTINLNAPYRIDATGQDYGISATDKTGLTVNAEAGGDVVGATLAGVLINCTSGNTSVNASINGVAVSGIVGNGVAIGNGFRWFCADVTLADTSVDDVFSDAYYCDTCDRAILTRPRVTNFANGDTAGDGIQIGDSDNFQIIDPYIVHPNTGTKLGIIHGTTSNVGGIISGGEVVGGVDGAISCSANGCRVDGVYIHDVLAGDGSANGYAIKLLGNGVAVSNIIVNAKTCFFSNVASTTVRYDNNVCWGARNRGMDANTANAVTLSFKNNVVTMADGVTSSARPIVIGSGVTEAITNNRYHNLGAALFADSGTTYASLSAWQAHGEDVNSSEGDPQFIGGPNPTTAEGFKPNCLTSPLKDAGTDVGAYQDFTGRYFTGAREIGAYACQGGTPRPTPTARPEITARPDNTARPTADARP